MSSGRLQNFRSFLTERFTAVATEVFGEVESIVVECREENKRLRNILHMVLGPEIKLHSIDINNYTREQPSEGNTGVDLEISADLTTKAKAEQIEYDISWDQRRALAEADNFITPDCAKEEHIEHDISLEQYPGLGEADNFFTSDCLKNESKEEDIADTTPIHVAYNRLEASANNSADEANKDGDCSSHKSEADCQSEEGISESHRFQKDSETSKTEVKMYCPFCGFQFENLTKFCCSCGKDISFVPAKDASTAAEQQHSGAKTIVQQFFKYREGKDAERRMFSKSKKKSKKTVKISVGIMNKKRTGMRPIRGKTLPLTVEPSWSSEKLLGAAIKKLKDFNQDMKDGEYILLYPDGSQIKNIPGTDTPFTIKLYKEAVGKSYQRITLFVCTLEEFLSEYGSVSEDEEDD